MDVRSKPWQYEFLTSKARFPAFVAGWATGKSMFGIMKAVDLSERYPGNLGVIFRKNFTDLRDSTLKDFKQYTGLEVAAQEKACKIGTSEILFRHADDISVLQNINLGWFWIEQAEELANSDTFDFLCGRLRRAGGVGSRHGYITANVNGHNWIYDLWKVPAAPSPDYPLWEASTYDNADVLPPDYLASLSGVKLRNPEIYARMVLNDWSAVAGGAFFDTWHPATHVCKPFPVPAEWERVVSIDYGYGGGASSVGYWAVDYGGRVYRHRELYEHKLTYTELAYRVLIACGRERPHLVVADPAIWGDRSHHKGIVGESGGETMAGIFWPSEGDADTWSERRRRGIPDTLKLTLQPGDNNRVVGWGRFREYLAVTTDQHGNQTPGMQVFDTCRDFIRTIGEQVHNENRPEDLDTDKEDHAVDDARLFLMSRPASPVAVVPPQPQTYDQRVWAHMKDLRKRTPQAAYELNPLGSEM